MAPQGNGRLIEHGQAPPQRSARSCSLKVGGQGRLWRSRPGQQQLRQAGLCPWHRVRATITLALSNPPLNPAILGLRLDIRLLMSTAAALWGRSPTTSPTIPHLRSLHEIGGVAERLVAGGVAERLVAMARPPTAAVCGNERAVCGSWMRSGMSQALIGEGGTTGSWSGPSR